ncbi:MAG: shikimate kinase [Acidobacteriota bacterium]
MSEFKLYAVSGNPIMFSQSPQIYNNLFYHFSKNAHYTRISSSSAHESLEIGKGMKLNGLNLTSPFKEEAVPLVHEISPTSEQIQAVNLILFRNSCLSGYNTDSYGVVQALTTNRVSIRGKKCMVLGAGGAGRAAAHGLLKSKAAQVILVNRTKSKAKKAAYCLGCDYAPVDHIEKIIHECDVFISCVPRLPDRFYYQKWPPNLNFLNANYKNPASTPLNKQKKINYISGLDWLLFQAFLSFRLMTGIDVSNKTKKSIQKKLMNKRNVHKSNIALIGFMGTGKTAVGRALAEKISANFLDTDQFIEDSEGLCINEIFKKKGEKKFRELEKSFIAKALPQSKNTVFSLGGGAVLDSNTVNELRTSCHIIWLWNSLEESLKRIDLKSRPLLFGSSLSKNAQLLRSRIPHYAKASDLVVPSPTKKIKKTAQRIKNEINQILPD